MRRLAASLVAFAAVVAAGCGSSSSGPGPAGGASVAPRSTAVLARADTSFDSAQWQTAQSLLRLFPGLSASLPRLDELKSATGPETDLLVLTASDLDKGAVLGLTQPRNPAQLDSALAAHDPPLVSEQVAGWHVVAADRDTIDRLKRARNEGSLAGSSAYRNAISGLPAHSLASVYVSGSALTNEVDRRAKTGLGPIPGVGRVRWLAGALSAQPGGATVDLRLKGDEIEATSYTAELPAQVPTPVALFVDAKGLDATLEELRRSPALSGQIGSAVKLLGGLLDDVVALFHDEAAFYVRPLPAGPEYTLVVKVDDEAKAQSTLGRLATLAGAFEQKLPEHLQVEGVPTTKLSLGSVTLYYAVFDGKLAVSGSASGIRGLARTGPRLADSPVWKAAAQAAGLPDQTTGIAYANIREAAPLIAKLAGSESAPSSSDLAPLRNALLFGSVSGSVLTVKGFVGVR